MNPDKNVLNQVFEGLAESGVRTMLWDSDDALVYAAPGMQDFYESTAFKKSSGKRTHRNIAATSVPKALGEPLSQSICKNLCGNKVSPNLPDGDTFFILLIKL